MRTTTQQIANLDKKVEANTEVTMASSGKVDEVHEILTAAKGFFKVAKWVGIALKWLGASCAAISAAIILYFQVMKK